MITATKEKVSNVIYIDRELNVWEDIVQGNLPLGLLPIYNQMIRDILLGKDTSFAFLQYKQYIDTGECVALLS